MSAEPVEDQRVGFGTDEVGKHEPSPGALEIASNRSGTTVGPLGRVGERIEG
jgi:hypothetical protein